ncbi:MAG TPA: ABC transporter ATP-binding protein [Alphaproteobacteria bacterium]|nr:ABC transporter ATP-binding protein [Alphaproteobacteria bacterium]
MSDIRAAQPGAGTEPLVRLRGVSKRFGKIAAVEPLDLEIRHGDFLAILGPSGCGKTTLLRLIGGFLTPTAGRIEIDRVDVTERGPERRPTNMVFQGYGLFPHMNVRQNIAYGPRLARVPREQIRARVDAIIDLVHLGELAERSPEELSGGQQQRVALARALIMKPKVLLLDEPLAALDLQLRKAMQDELRRIHASIGGTFVFVTHDQGEALGLANRIGVMQEGRIVQDGGPEEIYTRPHTRFVANFIGDANILPGRRQSGTVVLEGGGHLLDPGSDGPVLIVVRPEVVRLNPDLAADTVRLSGEVADSVYLGSHVKFRVRLSPNLEITAHESRVELRTALPVGARVEIGWPRNQHRVIENP